MDSNIWCPRLVKTLENKNKLKVKNKSYDFNSVLHIEITECKFRKEKKTIITIK